MANFKPDYWASTLPGYLVWYISDKLPKNGKERWGQLNSVTLKLLRKQPPGTFLKNSCSTNVRNSCILQHYQISTLWHVFLRNFAYVLNTLFYKTPKDDCFWVISNEFVSSSIFNNIYKKCELNVKRVSILKINRFSFKEARRKSRKGAISTRSCIRLAI